MKLAKITLTRGMFIPGLGERTIIENVEVDSAPARFTGGASLEGFVPVPGLLIVTPAAKVLIPWERVESVVTEWIKVNPVEATACPGVPPIAGLAAVLAGAQAHGTGMFASMDREARDWRPGDEPLPKPPLGVAQPPPPQKKGGRTK